MENKNKLYVLVDKKLDTIYAAVQGGHAVAEWLIYNYTTESEYIEDDDHNKDHVDYPVWNWNNDYLIYLAVNLKHWKHLLRHYNTTSYVEFDEPDLNYKTTAIAVWEGGLPENLKHKIGKEQLLK